MISFVILGHIVEKGTVGLDIDGTDKQCTLSPDYLAPLMKVIPTKLPIHLISVEENAFMQTFSCP